MTASLGRMLRERRGGLIFEFALFLPILVTGFLGAVEVARFALLHQKLDRVAATMGDLVSRADSLAAGDVDNMFEAAEHVMVPFDIAAHGVIVVSSVGFVGGGPRISWQRNGAGSLAAPSQIGTAGGPATLPNGMVVRDGENLIAAEVFYDFIPTFMAELVPSRRIYRVALFRPRTGALDTLN